MSRLNWKMCGGLLATVGLVTVSALQADQNDNTGRARISDRVTQTNYQEPPPVPEIPPQEAPEPPPSVEPPQANIPPAAPSKEHSPKFDIVPPPAAHAEPTPPPVTPPPAMNQVPFMPAAPTPAAPTPYYAAPAPPRSSCPTGGCATGGCATGGCTSPGCSTSPARCATGNCPTSSGSKGCCSSMAPGYQQRMASVLGNNGGSCCGSKRSDCNSGRGNCNSGGGNCNSGGGGCGCCNFLHKQSSAYQRKNAALSQRMFGTLGSDLFGWMVPRGCCGQGCPPVGTYGMVIAADANHFDARDGRLFGAPGYATPVTVPLAPTVHSQFNYGWGMPSSRITPISNPAGFSRLTW